MQPENSQHTTPSVEQLPMPPAVGPETVPTLPPIDSRLERGQERFEQAAEAGARVSDAAAAASNAAAPMAQPVVPQDTTQSVASSTTPLVAADDDLIEKEWVDKAKEIIEQTRDDPYVRTQRVNELQRDYLQKRYGKVVGAQE
jgi:hypothetical protein